jgi:hypothetical protein|tara:strand:+ start:181 stop:411 length:231 start_codon:yes stop_codon:yes gene_type:complete
MADTYTVKTYTEEELKVIDDKDKEITKEFNQNVSKKFTIRRQEYRIANCDEEIKILNDIKSSLQKEIDAAKAKLDE